MHAWRQRQAVRGFYRKTRCMIEVKFSPASACTMALPEGNECMKNSLRSPAAAVNSRSCQLRIDYFIEDE